MAESQGLKSREQGHEEGASLPTTQLSQFISQRAPDPQLLARAALTLAGGPHKIRRPFHQRRNPVKLLFPKGKFLLPGLALRLPLLPGGEIRILNRQL